MKKKIALFLIILMVGSWCLYAEESEASGVGPIVGGILGVALLICVIAILINPSVAEAPKDDSQPALASSDEPSPAQTGVKPSKTAAQPIGKVLNNPMLKHTMFEVTEDAVFIGARFSF
jgi:hypothetical protein